MRNGHTARFNRNGSRKNICIRKRNISETAFRQRTGSTQNSSYTGLRNTIDNLTRSCRYISRDVQLGSTRSQIRQCPRWHRNVSIHCQTRRFHFDGCRHRTYRHRSSYNDIPRLYLKSSIRSNSCTSDCEVFGSKIQGAF